MKRQCLLTAVSISFLACCLTVQAQRFDAALTELDSKYPQEKLYLHFDRSLYNPGETIWFKGYLMAGTFPSGISKTMYAELLDEQGKVLQRKSSPFTMSGAASFFDLPADIKSPVVYVRAYTRWMLNFDSSFLFVKQLPVAQRNKTGNAAPAPAAVLQFFPEGGNLVSGLSSRVAFKATNSRGLPIAVKGDIIDKANKKITSFSSQHDGMGFFTLLPLPGEQYKAVWKDPAGKTQETVLPACMANGIVLRADNKGGQIDFSIERSPDAPYKAVHIIAQLQQQMLYRAKANLTARPSASGSLPLKDIPAGIVQITVFSEDEQPLAERIVFVNQDDYYFITDLNAALKGMRKRARNVIQIDVPDTIACNLSVSVTDAGLNPAAKGEDDIFSHLLLTSDIKGYVHQPAHYFSGGDSAVQHLDLVMMTNGWRRFKWEDILANRWPVVKYEPENYLAIRGKVSGLNRSELAQKEITGFMETKAGRYFVQLPVNQDGTFSFEDMVFFDTARLMYQFNNDKNKILTTRGVFEFRNGMLATSPSAGDPLVQRFPALKSDSVLAAKNASLNVKRLEQEDAKRKVQTLAAVEVRARQKTKKEKLNDQYTSGMFTGDGNIFIMEDDPFAQSALDVFSYLRGRVAGLNISPGSMGGSPSLTWRGGTPGLFLDEMQMDASALQNIPMSDVAMIKVFSPPFMGGFNGGSGAIAVYTKRGRGGNTDDVKGLNIANIVGYSPLREFYSPDYSNYEQVKDEDADYRTTLYWNPFVITDKQNRRILLTFYNNDVTTRMRVVVEGINMEGKLTRIEKIFE